MNAKYTAKEKQELVDGFKGWYYEFDLGDGVVTKTNRENHMKWHNTRKNLFMGAVDKVFNGSMEGRTFLDIACNSGFWSFELARRGASYGLGIDMSENYIKQARLVAECSPGAAGYGNIEFKNMDFFDLPVTDRKFDLVLALGIVYHLTDPVGFFRKVHDLAAHCVLIDSTVSTMDTEEPVLEMANSRKYAGRGVGEFSFVPSEAALVGILHNTGFSNILKLYPRQDDEGSAFVKGSRLALLAFKD
ncbi:MAG: methyltransferase domain-containing protein [bacterium]|nr:methyltransferase domain-containing protein [bacterium]